MKMKITVHFHLACTPCGKRRSTSPAKEPAVKADNETKKPLVQIAILLDTSGSMEGLIEQAKSQLWKIVNEFAKAKQDGVTPEVQVALYEYGKSSLAAASGWSGGSNR